MCIITAHAHALKRIEYLEAELEGYKKTRPEPPPDSDWHPDSTRERPSSRDIIPTVNWELMKQALNLPQGSLYIPVADTGSMDGAMDFGHNIILVPIGHEAPYRIGDLQIGDVAAYQVGGTTLYLHRIWVIGEDEEGRKYTFWGDNNTKPDPYIVRDRHIKYLLVGIIYGGNND